MGETKLTWQICRVRQICQDIWWRMMVWQNSHDGQGVCSMEDFMDVIIAKIFHKVRGWIKVTIGKRFLLVYFMFQGSWINLRGIYFSVHN